MSKTLRVSIRTCEPSAFATYRRRCPLRIRSLTNTICFEFCDQDGERPAPDGWDASLPASVGVHDVDLEVAVAHRVEPIRLPFGDHEGFSSKPGLLVSLVWPELSGAWR